MLKQDNHFTVMFTGLPGGVWRAARILFWGQAALRVEARVNAQK